MIIDIKKVIKFIDKKIDLRTFTKFGVTGFINTGVDWLAFTVFLEIFGLQARFAQVAAHSIAIINSYIINKNWTFKNDNAKDKSRGGFPYKEIFKFLAVQGTSLCIGYAGMVILHNNLGLNEYLCKIPIVCVTIIINYFGNKLLVFK
jgi:putative flippase GtrA